MYPVHREPPREEGCRNTVHGEFGIGAGLVCGATPNSAELFPSSADRVHHALMRDAVDVAVGEANLKLSAIAPPKMRGEI